MQRADQMLLDAVRRDDVEEIKAALTLGANPGVSIEGVPLLHIAACSGRSEVVYLLLEANVEVNAKDRDGRTALAYVAWLGHSEAHGTIFDALIRAGADVNVADARGSFPLDMAAHFLNEPMVRRLVSLHAECSHSSRQILKQFQSPDKDSPRR